MTQFIRRPTFDQVRTNESRLKLSFRTVYQSRANECSETHFWSTFISSNWIKSEFLITLKADQKWIFEQIESRDH